MLGPITGGRHSELAPEEVVDKLRHAMAAANFEILDASPEGIAFTHGTLLTQTAAQFPKRGRIEITPDGAGSRVDYSIEVIGFAKYWILLFGIALCWLILPAVAAYHILKLVPRNLMNNLLQCL